MDSKVMEVVDRYISILLVADLNNEAGWRGRPNEIQLLIDNKGYLPRCDGVGSHDDNMINKVSMMFPEVSSKYSQWCGRTMRKLKQRNITQYSCLFIEAAFSGRPNPNRDNRYYTQEDMAEMAGLSRSAYQSNLSKGVEKIKDYMDVGIVEAA
jgi:hypothetical protein